MEPPDVLSASEPMPGDRQISLTAGNVIAKGLDHPQGPHRVHIEYMGPGFVVGIASLLPRRAGDPRAVDEHVYRDILELRSGVLDAFGIGYIHCNDVGMPPVSCAKHRSLLAASGLRNAANTRHPSAKY
jgi:hypothetical protein